MTTKDQSPTIQEMSFRQALEHVILGQKVTRKEWNNHNIYGLIKADILMLFQNGTYNHWVLSIGDLVATDWILVPVEGN